MFKSIDEVKAFIEWASKKGVARAKIGEIEFDIYSVKLLQDVSESQIQAVDKVNKPDGEDFNEDDLFWSSGG